MMSLKTNKATHPPLNSIILAVVFVRDIFVSLSTTICSLPIHPSCIYRWFPTAHITLSDEPNCEDNQKHKQSHWSKQDMSTRRTARSQARKATQAQPSDDLVTTATSTCKKDAAIGSVNPKKDDGDDGSPSSPAAKLPTQPPASCVHHDSGVVSPDRDRRMTQSHPKLPTRNTVADTRSTQHTLISTCVHFVPPVG